MSWRAITLGEAIHVKHGFAFKGEYFSSEGQYVVLTPGNFHEAGGFRIRPDKERYYVGDIPEDYILREGDLIVAMTEQGPGLLGSSALIPEGGRYLHNQRLGLVQIVRPDLIDKEFLYYLFNTRGVRGQISGSATGTKVRHTAPERIYRVRALLPDVRVQREIARTLRGYDDLIVNNKRRIELLEQSARLLFKEWFVNLRYPAHEHDKIASGVPNGWKTPSFTDLADFINGYAFKPSHWEDTGLPIIKIPELKEGVRQGTPRYSGFDVPEKLKVRAGDLLFSWSGTLAIDFWADEDGYLNQHLFLVKPYGRPGAAFLLLALREALPAFANLSVGATMKHIRRSALEQTTVLLPPPALLCDFEEIVDANYTAIINLRKQIGKLEEARDLLLPRLMDGRLTA